jgi:hypothetical protein
MLYMLKYDVMCCHFYASSATCLHDLWRPKFKKKGVVGKSISMNEKNGNNWNYNAHE